MSFESAEEPLWGPNFMLKYLKSISHVTVSLADELTSFNWA